MCKQVIFICELVSPRDVNVVSVMKIKLFYLMDDAAWIFYCIWGNRSPWGGWLTATIILLYIKQLCMLLRQYRKNIKVFVSLSTRSQADLLLLLL